MNIRITPSQLEGVITPPPSKSLAHRALLAASMANGTSIIHNLELSEDIQATLNAVMALGARVKQYPLGNGRTDIEVTGGKRTTDPVIDCGESGSTLRFVIPLALVLGGGGTFTGRGRLGQRPLTPYKDICCEQGLSWEAADEGLPLAIKGRLRAGHYEVPGDISSQFITGLLMALPLLEGDSTLEIIGKLESRPYVDLTLHILERYGIAIKESGSGGFEISGRQSYQAADYRVEGDWSQAAFLVVMGALGGGVTIKGLDRNSKQGDRAMEAFLEQMGANLTWEDDKLHVKRSRLKAANIDLSDCPDLAPPVAAACAAAEGVSTLTGIKRLRLKESDRVESIASALRGAGGKVTVEADRLLIEGSGLKGGVIDASGDHRIAMLGAALSPACSGNITVQGAEAVNKSWPSFWEDAKALGGEIIYE